MLANTHNCVFGAVVKQTFRDGETRAELGVGYDGVPADCVLQLNNGFIVQTWKIGNDVGIYFEQKLDFELDKWPKCYQCHPTHEV